ncbi:hypothetical protein RHGRI_016784 [Rhododendron griersonianum]|uniref:Uncharacterized protein n=1 Tax=Rhododendron griersonianum TaxID=479676 RepID=A0AAV6JVN4_9ERIC|nr:hypothetical protein RHGRI_016784 [Rhododendron griersonianum]
MEEPPYEAPLNFQEGQASGKDHDKEDMFKEMMISFREMAQTQRAMIKSIKNRLPHPESARNSPGNIGLNDHANSNTHQSPFEGRLGEDIGQGKMKSRLGKEKMYPEQVPQSWYEPVKPMKPVQEIPKEPFGINLGVPRNTRNTQNVNPLFEPTFGGWKDDTELDRGANYLVFKDLDRKGRDVPSSPFLSVQRREIPPLKKANIGQTSKPHEETKQEEFTLVKGVPDWFLKQVKPDLFQGYKNSTRSGNKTFKPPSSNSRNWVLISDPKSKKPQMVSLLSKTQKMKLQRKYLLFQSGESSTGEESGRGASPNPRFNRAQRDSEEEFRIQFREEETLKKVAFTMLEEDLDPPSPNSLASYQSGLLEAMLVEQGGIEGSSSPMEVSTQKVESKETVKEETVKPTKEVSSIQFGSQPEVQVNMVYPCSMNFFKNGQTV